MRVLALTLTLALTSSLPAEAVKDREGAVRKDREKLQSDARWNYNNVEAAFTDAKSGGKPVMLVLRCVPCLACMGMDSGVLMAEQDLTALLDQFVCVRLINCNALDMARFQFDYDLSFSVLFLNGDGTTYGRYGSWKHQKNSQETALAGLKKAMTAALAVHTAYPGNKASLTSKQPVPQPVKTPVELPTLAERYKPELDWEGKVVQSCVHCHMIGHALQTWHRQQGKPLPEQLIYPFPEPEVLGLTMASEEIGQVESVAAGSIAAEAGLQQGDSITAVAAAPILSIADLSWALHQSADAGSLALTVKRGGKDQALTLTLPTGWRRNSRVTDRATIWPERGMALGGMRLEPCDAPGLGLKIIGVGQYGLHATAKKNGFQVGDLLQQFGGLTDRTSEGKLIGHLLQNKRLGEVVPVKVLRGDKTVELKLPMQ
jgi:serine protease Do